MKRAILSLTTVVSLTALQAHGQIEVFQRKPGLWEMTISAHGQRQVMKQCSDASTDALLQQSAAGMNKACSKQVSRREGANYVAEAECRMGGSLIKSRAVFSGDFSTSYTGDVTATYDPPLMGQKESKTTISARHIGDCEPGQKPGDMVLPGGIRMNIKELANMQMPNR